MWKFQSTAATRQVIKQQAPLKISCKDYLGCDSMIPLINRKNPSLLLLPPFRHLISSAVDSSRTAAVADILFHSCPPFAKPTLLPTENYFLEMNQQMAQLAHLATRRRQPVSDLTQTDQPHIS
ncbi:hypothetical protein ATANTOWER_030493 [Ataeniobius toweri]|uniref:Uncharacterized protein n=1 Tax=Ataeniobius toweri TaxID=208326 RepID=A0ABU7CDT5_9TELE|nr:hypothetical protein [Ataeniobius toweri]